MKKICLITGGCGFIGSYLVRKLLKLNYKVRVVDNLLRADISRLEDIIDEIEFFNFDIRDSTSLTTACKNVEVVFHLAAINGTENFYLHPEAVLDVGIRGMLAVIEACKANNVPDLIVASSAEVYQTAETIPTAEDVALSIPNSLNPRYSYAGSKIISELIAFNYAQDNFHKLQVFRPHNVYGADMGYKHVIPQFISKALTCKRKNSTNFNIQGSGNETRAFAYIDDVIDGIIKMHIYGKHREIYHIGNDEETSIKALVAIIAKQLQVDLTIIPGETVSGSTLRRCPNISKMRSLGYIPNINLRQGIAKTCDWYVKHSNKKLVNNLL